MHGCHWRKATIGVTTVKLGKLVNTVKLKASKRLGKRLPKRF